MMPREELVGKLHVRLLSPFDSMLLTCISIYSRLFSTDMVSVLLQQLIDIE